MASKKTSMESTCMTDHEQDELALLDAIVDDYERAKAYPRRKSWIRRNWRAVSWHLLFNAFTLVLMVYGIGDIWNLSGICKSPIYDPGRPYLSYEVRELEYADEDMNEFKPLTDEADKAWHDLMDYTYIRLTEKDLATINKTSKILRWAVNLDRYTHEFGERDLIDLPKHTSHCLDTLRQSIMCRADLSPNTFHWIEGKRTPHSEFYSAHQCAKWDGVMDYLRENHVQVNAPGVLNHPIYGPSYPGARRVDEKWDTPQVLPPIPYTGPMAVY
ncbi:hypothetical protein F5Y15DRAFT_425869 [Xylariaceae sp. FL0016]|nr:hypothetical protein F5Y15DRAFT_425869 [Xylariaceae sp. FL0016]